MSLQSNCVIAQPWAMYGFAKRNVAVKLHIRGSEPSRDLERWSG
ncbi:hypothetical protein [Actinoplanes sp. NPDC051859]